MTNYQLYDLPMTPAPAPKVQASVGFLGWIMILIVSALVAAGVAVGVMFLAMRQSGGGPMPPDWDVKPEWDKESSKDSWDGPRGDEKGMEAVPAERMYWIEMDGKEGTVSIPANTPQWREQAMALASGMWPDGYEIVWEEEAMMQPGRPDSPDGPARTEYHIHFRGK